MPEKCERQAGVARHASQADAEFGGHRVEVVGTEVGQFLAAYTGLERGGAARGIREGGALEGLPASLRKPLEGHALALARALAPSRPRSLARSLSLSL